MLVFSFKMRRSFLIWVLIFGLCPISVGAKEDYDTDEYLDFFEEVLKTTEDNYVDEIDSKDMIESALSGMLSSLDPHSGYMSKSSFDEMRQETKGEFGGLGIEVVMEQGLVKVVSPIDDTPAEKAGLMSGDLITHLDDNPVMGMTLDEAIHIMRGKVGAKIKLRIVRQNVRNPIEKEIVRDIIKSISANGKIINDIGYIRIRSFNENTTSSIQKVFKDFKKTDKGRNLPGYVIDLRNNPGGLLDQAVSVSDTFLEKGEIVSIRETRKKKVERFNASSGDIAKGKPIVVLINAGSASAAEILAGALQDHNRAVIVGNKSFGKGSVQTIIPFSDKGAIKITTARYYTPSGRSIQALGIDPDVVVEQALPTTEDESLKIEQSTARKKYGGESDLPNSLKNDQLEKNPSIVDNIKKHRKDVEQIAELRTKDPQLAYAIDLLHGLLVYSRASSR